MKKIATQFKNVNLMYFYMALLVISSFSFFFVLIAVLG
jgi:hypothetical protein